MDYNRKKRIPKFPLRKKYNYGFGLLKVYLSLTVIISHCCKRETTKNKFIFLIFVKSRRIHVPAFFILSFYFMYENLIAIKFRKILGRLERLFIPYLGWPIVIYILHNNLFYKFIKNNRKYSIVNLKNQLLWGNIYISQFWFQWDLIMITILFYVIIFIFKKYNLLFLQLLALFSYFLQYSGYNLRFYRTLKPENKECLGRLAESFPNTVTGFSFASLKVFDILNNYKIKTLIFSSLTFILLEKYSLFPKINGISYSGIDKNIRAISLILIFLLFPSDKITNTKVKRVLREFTNYTAGIFYLHNTVFLYFRNFIEPIKSGTFFGCVIIYIIAYLFCFIGSKIAGKSKFKNLFA